MFVSFDARQIYSWRVRENRFNWREIFIIPVAPLQRGNAMFTSKQIFVLAYKQPSYASHRALFLFGPFQPFSINAISPRRWPCRRDSSTLTGMSGFVTAAGSDTRNGDTETIPAVGSFHRETGPDGDSTRGDAYASNVINVRNR